ncbi:MAG TPA: UDP-N-acetylmuramoyl-L-alanyl-D-glutamate--2,6-diaminopimelate ligase [Nitriliruptorales bacterium]
MSFPAVTRPPAAVPVKRVAEALAGGEIRGGATVVDVTHDSRQVGQGWLFCCVPGADADGHDFAPAAVGQGASALLVERWLDDLAVAQVRVASVRAAMGPAAAVVHGHPSRDLRIVGVTGTNGKTTTTYLLETAFGAAGWGTGLVGTVQMRIHGAAQPGVRTTPEGPDLQRLLRTMHSRGVDAVAIEVSSHGLDLHRADGTWFACTVFTNLTQDHLDHHGTMDAYFTAKARLFTPAFSDRAVVCVDGEWGQRLASQASIDVTTYGRDATAQHRIVDVAADTAGTRFTLSGPDGDVTLRTRLLGDFNAGNAAAAYLAATAVGVPADAAIAGIAACDGVPGRLEPVDAGQPFAVLVDYAHTPDALDHVVRAARGIADGRTIVVVGCGGDRDTGKRPLMGAVAAQADVAVLTSDNPRSEDPQAILAAVAEGARRAVDGGAPAAIRIEVDRRAAIALALQEARPGDVVVVAGKGHETGQELAEATVPFDDRLVALELLGGHPPGDQP